MLDDENKEIWKEKALTEFLTKFPFGLGIIVLTIIEGFTDLFSKEPPFTSMELSNTKTTNNEKKV